MGKTTVLRRELKTTFFPMVESRGFTIDRRHGPTFTRWRRAADDSIHLLEIQWDKYGRPRFVVNVGRCAPAGMYVRGQHFPVEDVFVGWLAEHGRLQPWRGRGVSSWFSQDRPVLMRLLGSGQLRPAGMVVRELLNLFPEAEAYWASGVVGPHLTVFRMPRSEEGVRS